MNVLKNICSLHGSYYDNFSMQKKVLVTGGHGFLGSHVVQQLHNFSQYVVFAPEHALYDLCEQSEVRRLFADVQPDIVIHLAARVGGIGENRQYPGQLFYDNALMGIMMMECARKNHVEKYINIGTVCSYPSQTPVPFSEDALWDGYPEKTNAPYGIAKKMLLTQAQAYREEYGFHSLYLILTNLYGPKDNTDVYSSHVIPALIRKFCTAVQKEERNVVLWGDGTPTRELLYVGDAARVIVDSIECTVDTFPINIGSGEEVSIAELAGIIAEKAGYHGTISWDTSYPNGQMKRKIDSTKARKYLNSVPEVSLQEGLDKTIAWYKTIQEDLSVLV